MAEEPMYDQGDTTADAAGGPPPEIRAIDAIQYTIGLFADLAWIKLGLRANPASGESKLDLPQARLAIDALAALVPLTEGQLDAHMVRDLNNLLSSLRMNYVQKFNEQGQ